MSTDRDVNRIVRSWLEEGVTALPDRVLDIVLDQLPATPQRRSWRAARRFAEMNMYARGAIVATAVVVIAVLGVALLPKDGGIGGPGTTRPPSFEPSPSQTPAAASIAPIARGDILFCSNRDTHGGPDEIYGMHADGSDLRRLTNEDVAEDWMPVLSPDGTKIAFGSDRPSRAQQAIYLMNVDGSGQVKLTNNAQFNSYRPTWSPDGTKIAFGSDSDPGELFYINVDGSGQVRLTTGHQDGHPAWSPDGRRIAFQRRITDTKQELFVMNADGSGQIQLTHAGVDVTEFVTWSPDGTQLAFDSERAGNQDIFIVNADGTGERRLTMNPAKEAWPAWSPDGRQIAFARNTTTTTADIYTMNVDGSGEINLTHDSANDWCPSWH